MTAREVDLTKFNPPPLAPAERLRRLKEQREALTQHILASEEMLAWVDQQISFLE